MTPSKSRPGGKRPYFLPSRFGPARIIPTGKTDELWNQLEDTWVAKGEIAPETAYARKKNGQLVTEQNKHLLSKTYLDRRNEAPREYH